uniref:Uncharacterized protein LOC104219717 n=1 Tax=Nicotiana sylvestris TaxID=4096 RepID=A0A1U7VL71_NICSY|nr:PREDICTED: uncharacterized protein LOC104219717 [Nicotiana sylvestris]
MEAIRILIAFASHMEFKLLRMDIKSAFLNGYLKEEVFIKQPPGFECHEHHEHVFKLEKALYGFKHDPQKREEPTDYAGVDDIIFGATNDSLCEEFANFMRSKHAWKLQDKQSANDIAIFERMTLIFSKSVKEPGSHCEHLIFDNIRIFTTFQYVNIL